MTDQLEKAKDRLAKAESKVKETSLALAKAKLAHEAAERELHEARRWVEAYGGKQ